MKVERGRAVRASGAWTAFGGVCASLRTGGAFLFLLILAAGAFPPAAQAQGLSKKLMVVIYNPALESEGGQTLVSYAHWNDPDQLTAQAMQAIAQASGGYVSYVVAERIQVDGIPVKGDGFAYTDASYLACLADNATCHSPDLADYARILSTFDACGKLNRGEIDELWLWGGGWFGYYESRLAGPGAFWYNSPPLLGTSCGRLLPIMGFNYSTGVDHALHSFGHRAESALTYAFGTWDTRTWPPSGHEADHDWDRFTYNRTTPGVPFTGCGNIHYPPNALHDYEYGNPDLVTSNCNDWLSYPDPTGSTEVFNCAQWGCSQDGYMRWWLSHLPKAPSRRNTRSDNWWDYVVGQDFPPSQFRFYASSYTVDEANPRGFILVLRTGDTTTAATVDYSTSDGTATAGQDYAATSGRLDFVAGLSVQSFAVPILPDSLVEGSETILLRLSNPTGGAGLGGRDTVALTITDDDVASAVQFASPTFTVREKSGSAKITVTRIGGLASGVTVHYSTSDGTATAGQDYAATSGTLSFGPGQTSQSFLVAVTNDALAKGKGTLLLSLSAPTGGTLGSPNAAVLTITDDDLAGTVQFSAPTYAVDEGGPYATITVTRTGGTAGGVTVDYATSEVTATAGQDYTATSGALLFGPGATRLTFSVPILDDGLVEGNETIRLDLSNPAGGAKLGPLAAAVLHIREDNPVLQFSSASYSFPESTPTAVITVKRSGQTATPASVSYATSDGTAKSGVRYMGTSGVLFFGPGVLSQSFAVPLLNDTRNEASETVLLRLSAPSAGTALGQQSTAVLTIGDNDAPGQLAFSLSGYRVMQGSASASITVRRLGGTASGVTVDFATLDRTAAAGVDYTATSGSLSFGPGIVSRSFTVPLLAPRTPEPDLTLQLALSNPTGGASIGTPRAAVLTLTSRDPLLQFSAGSYTVGETGPKALITVKRSGPLGGVLTVNYATADGTATAGSDYAPVSGTLTFGPRTVAQTFAVPVSDGALVEGDETIHLGLSNPTGGAALGTLSTAILIIKTDDPSLSFSKGSYTVSESAPAALIIVRRSLPASRAVEIDYATSDGTAHAGSDYQATSSTLSFEPGVTTRAFVVPILNDTSHEVGETMNLSLTNPVNARVGTPSTAVLKIGDNDVAGSVQFSLSDFSASAADGNATVTVTRTGGSASGVSVRYSTSDGTAQAGTDYEPTSGTLLFGQGATSQTFTLNLLRNPAATANRTVSLTLDDPGGGAVLGPTNQAALWIVEAP